MKVVSIVSGGLDSVTMLYNLADVGMKPIVLSFDYGQRHKKELLYARDHATYLGAPFHVLDMTEIARITMGDSVLTGRTRDAVPEGHYADESMKATVVPNRNSIMLNIAAAMAISTKAQAIATAVHAGDHAIYPDCRPTFIMELERTLKTANEGFIDPDFKVMAPYVFMDKAEIARTAWKLGFPIAKTWSCYKGGELHCGLCATCIERREALHKAGVTDPTIYEVSFDKSMAAGKISVS